MGWEQHKEMRSERELGPFCGWPYKHFRHYSFTQREVGDPVDKEMWSGLARRTYSRGRGAEPS